nr:antitoxin Xre/MbcA/ParS toxin-binding domain-containing protein [Pseudomonas fluorescens]
MGENGDISDDFLRLAVGSVIYSIGDDIEVVNGLITQASDNGLIMRTAHLEYETPAYSARHQWRDDRARCPMEDVALPSAKVPRLTGLNKVEGKPVDLLVHGRNIGDDAMLIVHLTDEGFELSDVVDMLSTSELYQQGDVVKRITGKSVRTVRRLLKEGKPVRLDPQQSVIAYQYALVLELAIRAFGGQPQAEEWMQKSSTYFYGHVPLELTLHPLGFQMVEQYLSQVIYGVYP